MADRQLGEFCTLYRSLWDDVAFRGLSAGAQHLFVAVKSTLPVSGIGVVPAWAHVYAKRTHRAPKSVIGSMRELGVRPWIDVEGDVLWVVRGLEFEPSMNATNSNHRKYIQRLVGGLPQTGIVSRYRQHYGTWFDMRSPMPSEGVRNGIGMASKKGSRTHREAKSQSQSQESHSHTPTAVDTAAERAFDEAWQLYPRRPGDSRAKALRAFQARVRAGVNPEALVAGVRAYAAHVERESHRATWEPRFIKQGATFFGPDRFWEAEWGPAEDELVQVYDDRGLPTPEAAALMGRRP